MSICLDSVLMLDDPSKKPQIIFMMFLSIQWENLLNHLLLQYDIYVDSMIKEWLGRIVNLKFKGKKYKKLNGRDFNIDYLHEILMRYTSSINPPHPYCLLHYIKKHTISLTAT